MKELTFQYYWVIYLNSAPRNDFATLDTCLSNAETFDELCQVFTAASNHFEDDAFTAIRSVSLKRLIAIAADQTQAKKALGFASKRGRFNRPYYPARYKEAVDKMATFELVA